MKQDISIIRSPFGNIELIAEGAFLTYCRRSNKRATVGKTTPVLKEAAKQLDAYFKGKLTEFDLPLLQRGTKFQMKVWDTILTIPYGSTWSYKQLARAVGNPNASRAVGTANGCNEIWIIVPCHRVIASGGGLGGYGGGLDVKQKLLDIEKRDIPISLLP
jgi:methylated-DNA-[protein]-cysteine S-methyltransferase